MSQPGGVFGGLAGFAEVPGIDSIVAEGQNGIGLGAAGEHRRGKVLTPAEVQEKEELTERKKREAKEKKASPLGRCETLTEQLTKEDQ